MRVQWSIRSLVRNTKQPRRAGLSASTELLQAGRHSWAATIIVPSMNFCLSKTNRDLEGRKDALQSKRQRAQSNAVREGSSFSWRTRAVLRSHVAVHGAA
jgi:hypothetical protein